MPRSVGLSDTVFTNDVEYRMRRQCERYRHNCMLRNMQFRDAEAYDTSTEYPKAGAHLTSSISRMCQRASASSGVHQ